MVGIFKIIGSRILYVRLKIGKDPGNIHLGTHCIYSLIVETAIRDMCLLQVTAKIIGVAIIGRTAYCMHRFDLADDVTKMNFHILTPYFITS